MAGMQFQNILIHYIFALCSLATIRFGNESDIYRLFATEAETVVPTYYGENKNRLTLFVKHGGLKLTARVSVDFYSLLKSTVTNTHARTHKAHT